MSEPSNDRYELVPEELEPQREARRVIELEARAMQRAAERLGPELVDAVELLFGCRGKVVVCGSGKSGLVGRKIASTLASTGTPALFLHPADGGHGDLGVVVRGDVALLISYSGENEELIRILPGLKKIGIPIVALCAHASSTLGSTATVRLDISVAEEACPNGLAPTASTAVTMAIGDALAVVLLKRRGFRREDFALLHPGGAIGRRLLTRVADLMHANDANARVVASGSMQHAIVEMTAKGLGAVSVVDEEGRLVGLLTDGDLRRGLERHGASLLGLSIEEVMTRSPVTIAPERLAVEAVHLMEDRPSQISVLPVVDGAQRAVGLLRLHDLVRAGVA